MRKVAVLVLGGMITVWSFGAVATPGDGGPPGHPACLPNSALENDEVRLWFQGQKGHLKVFDSNASGSDEPVHVYTYQTGAVQELDEAGAVLGTFRLDRAYPHDSTCAVDETEDWLNITYEVTTQVHGETGGDALGVAVVTFLYHWNKSAEGAKFDLFVADWPWQAEDSHVAFTFDVHAPVYTIEVAENGLGFRNATGDSVGYIEWAPNATAYYEDGHNETALVDSDTTGDDHNATVTLHFTNVTAGYTLLEYDPWVGLGDYIILLGILVPLGPAAAVLPAPLRPLYDWVSPLI